MTALLEYLDIETYYNAFRIKCIYKFYLLSYLALASLYFNALFQPVYGVNVML